MSVEYVHLLRPQDRTFSPCRCGTSLAYSGIPLVTGNYVHRSCPRRQEVFDPNTFSGWACLGPVKQRSPRDKKPFAGGALARFAISISVGGILTDKDPGVAPTLLQICHTTLGQSMVQCGEKV